MAKFGFTKNTVPNLVDSFKTWALCIGSGISFPLFPLWKELARKVVHRFAQDVDLEFDDLSLKLTPDIILQAVADKAGVMPEDFSKNLAEVLYEDFLSGLSKEDLYVVRKCMTCDPGASGVPWDRYLGIVNSILAAKGYNSLTAMVLAESVLKLKHQGRAPSSILSFNAEMLFGSLLNAIAHLKYGENKKFLDYIIEPISFHDCYRIPYYFCHGVMPVPGTRNTAASRFNAADRLVFSENEYLQLANSSYSWQSSAFISTLSSHTVIFVGLSFADPNIRRWLAWIQKEKQQSIQRKTKKVCDSTSHYWIEKKPASTVQMRMLESSVSHLGIRIIWIDDWSEVGEVLEKGIVI